MVLAYCYYIEQLDTNLILQGIHWYLLYIYIYIDLQLYIDPILRLAGKYTDLYSRYIYYFFTSKVSNTHTHTHIYTCLLYTSPSPRDA